MGLLDDLRQDLNAQVDENHRASIRRFFKHEVLCYGVKLPTVRKIAKLHFKKMDNPDKSKVFELAEALFANKFHEEAIIATQWVTHFQEELERKDLEIFGSWIDNYLDNWAKIDDFCLHVTYPLLAKYPELTNKLQTWARSDNLWVRRASAVTLITKHKSRYVTSHPFASIIEITKILLDDKEDLVLKGYGWMLKAASINFSKQVFDFLMAYKNSIPRKALRYATENLDEDLKKQILSS